MSVVTELADAVTLHINRQTFSPAIIAKRSYLPIFDLGKVGDSIQVSVVPRSLSVSEQTRAQNTFDVVVDIGVQRRVTPGDSAQIDELLGLVEQIGDSLRLRKLDVMPEASWISNEHEALVFAEHLDQHNVFTSVLSATYRIIR